MNIIFRRIDYEDIEFINRVRNQYAKEYLHDSRTFTLIETNNWFIVSKPDYWMIINGKDTIGYFRLSNHSTANQNIYIGADIAPEFTGKGFAKEAYKLFIPFIFNLYNLNKISLEVLKEDKFVDSIIMSTLKEEYNGFVLENK